MANNSVSVVAKLNDSGVVSGLKTIKAEMTDIKGADGKLNWSGLKSGGDATKALGEGVSSLGSSMTVGLTVPIIAAGGAATAVAAKFDDAMSQVSGALADPSADMEGLRQLALQLGSDTVFSATEAGQAMVELAKGGLTEADIKGGALKASMDLAAAGSLELADAASTTVQMMGSFGLGAEDAARIANALAGAANASSADVSDLTQAMSQCSAQAALAGWSLEDTAAALALFADHGVKGSDAGTSLKTMLQRLAAPTDDAAEAMAAYGLEVRDSDGHMKNITSIADELTGKLGTLSDAERDAALQTIFGSDASRAAAILMQSGSEGLRDYIAATNDSTAAETMANAQKGELSWAMENMSGAIETASIAFGTALAPAVTAVAGFIGDAAEAFASLPSDVQTAIVIVLALVAALGPLLMIVGSIIAILPALSEGMLVLSGAFAVPLAPILAIVAAIAAVVAVVVYLWNTSTEFQTAVTEAWNTLMASIMAVVDQLRPYVEEAWAAIQNAAVVAMDTLMPVVEGAFLYILAVVVPVLSSLLETVGNVFQVILQTITGVMNGISQIISGVWNVISGVVQTVCGFIQGVVTGDFSAMQAGISSIMNGISSICAGVWNTIASVVSGIVNGILSVVSGVFNAISSTISGTMSGIANIIGNTMGDAQNVVSNALNAIAGFFSGLHLEFPHINLPHFSISGSFSLDPPSIPSIGVEWYKTGAIAMGPSVVGIGDGGHPEAVVPLGGHYMDPYADAVAQRLDELGGGNDSGTTIIYQIGDVTVNMDQMRDLATLEDFVNLLKSAKRENPTKTRSR